MGRSKSKRNYIPPIKDPTLVRDFGPPPPPPSPTEWRDTFDFLTRTKQITTTGPDGKKRHELHRIPGTPQEEELLDMSRNLMNSAMKNMEQLYKYNPDDLLGYEDLITAFSEIKNDRIQDISQTLGIQDFRQDVDQFRRMKSEMLDRAFDEQRRKLEADLGSRGLENSSIADAKRNALASAQRRERSLAEVENRKFGSELAKEDFAQKRERFELREYGRQQHKDYLGDLYDVQRQDFFDRDQLRRQALQEQSGLFGLGQGVINDDRNLALKSQAPQMANNAFNAEASEKQAIHNAQMNAYNANVNAQLNRANTNNNANNANFYGHLDMFRNKPQTSRQQLLGIAANMGGMAMGSTGSSFGSAAGGMLANKLFGQQGGINGKV
jgi:hypothetical protein